MQWYDKKKRKLNKSLFSFKANIKPSWPLAHSVEVVHIQIVISITLTKINTKISEGETIWAYTDRFPEKSPSHVSRQRLPHMFMCWPAGES